MSEIFDFASRKRKQIAKKTGSTEFEVYLNHLTCTAISRYTGKELNDIKINDDVRELCQGEAEKLDYIIGSIQATLDVNLYSSEWDEKDPFSMYPTVYSIIEYFYIKAGKQNKQNIPAPKTPEKKKENDDSNNKFLF